jgi:hypothetical protein
MQDRRTILNAAGTQHGRGPLRERLAKAEKKLGANPPKREAPKVDLEKMGLRRWTATIPHENKDKYLSYLTELEPWMEASQRLHTQIAMQMNAIKATQGNPNANPDSLAELTKRMAHVVALKEDVDILISDFCLQVLEELEEENPQEVEESKGEEPKEEQNTEEGDQW